MSSLSTLPKGDSAWLLRKAIERIIQQVSVLETNIGSSTTGNSSNTQVIFNDNGTLRGDPDLIFNTSQNKLVATALESTTSLFVGTSATITGDLTVATDRLKVVTGSTAIQTGATTQLQVGTTSWPSSVIGKSGSRSLFGNAGEVIIWNESAAAIGNYSTLFVSAKTGAGATTMGGLQIRAGIENASNSDGFVSLWTSNNTAGGFVERYKIDSTGIATWSNVGGVAGTAMTLNSTGLGVGGSAVARIHAIDSSGVCGLFTRAAAPAAALSAAYITAPVSSGFSNSPIYGFWYQNTGISNPASECFAIRTNSTDRLYVDATGNVGIGVTPSAWGSNYKAVEVSGAVNVFGATSDGNLAGIGANLYHNNTNYLYRYATFATMYLQDNGTHQWHIAPSGTAGNAITFTQAMTLDASGNLGVGVAGPSYRLQANVATGGDRDIFAAQVTGASNGFQVQWNNGTQKLRVNFSDLPTSSAGLPVGTLWIDTTAGNTLKVA